MTLNYAISRRRFPLRPKSVVTPPARFTLIPAQPEQEKIAKLIMERYTDNGETWWMLTGEKAAIIVRDSGWGLYSHTRVHPLRVFEELKKLHEGTDNADKLSLNYDYGGDRAIISLIYKVPAQPATKQPRPLSSKFSSPKLST